MALPIKHTLACLLILAGVACVQSKVFERCELAQLLQQRHRLTRAELATWVCIAQHASGFNTATFGGGTGPGGGSHGLFQISDVYWCDVSPGQARGGCNLSCARLRDDELTDDLACAHQIHAEHQRISGDGYTAWQAYEPYCKHNAQSYIADCPLGSGAGGGGGVGVGFGAQPVRTNYNYGQSHKSSASVYTPNAIQDYKPAKTKGKIYNRCELAQELLYKHSMPMQQIPTWVCIAQHESHFDTSAVGRLNADGSADHGLFQISDLFWCSHERSQGGKACGLPCSKLLDSDITDDVRCVKRIFNEHTGISGDGFTAWTVYNRDCRNQRYEHVAACFNKPATNKHQQQQNNHHPNALVQAPQKSYANPFFTQAQPQPQASYSTNVYARPPSNTQQSYQSNPFLHKAFAHQQHPNAITVSHKPGAYITNTQTYNIQHQQKQKHQKTTATSTVINALYNNNYNKNNARPQNTQYNTRAKGKVYKRCELAQEMYFKHKFPIQDIATWVCIAEHESRYDTSAIGRLNTDGSADHGLFQISDLYWCTHDQRGGKGCGLPCEKLIDSDITDDVACIRTIHEEHTRISGDGFTAWVVYNRNCRQERMERIVECFDEDILKQQQQQAPLDNELNKIEHNFKPSPSFAPKGKIYKRCELAQELYFKHKMPMQQIPTWVCIAKHESSFNTAAVGRLNTDGSADHGLFQISDLYWCTHDQRGGKGCNSPCENFLDSDITDDIGCIKTIHEEHTRISGDGFTAWVVYNRNCRQQTTTQIADCFEEQILKKELAQTTSIPTQNAIARPTATSLIATGKIYKRCELAQELYFKHNMPMQQIPTWVCIAKYESSFNTAAVGRLNTDGSADHGLFQISDLYWCTHDAIGGKACNIPCSKLLDNDISDDVHCIKIIYAEHTRISGDGFTAWTVYNQHCRQQHLTQVSDCFEDNEIEMVSSATQLSEETAQATKGNYNFGNNIFLNNLQIKNKPIVSHNKIDKQSSTTTLKPKTTNTQIIKHPYSDNPFFNKQTQKINSQPQNNFKGNPFLNNQILETNTKIKTDSEKDRNSHKQSPYQVNPFLNSFVNNVKTTASTTSTTPTPWKTTNWNRPTVKPTTTHTTTKPTTTWKTTSWNKQTTRPMNQVYQQTSTVRPTNQKTNWPRSNQTNWLNTSTTRRPTTRSTSVKSTTTKSTWNYQTVNHTQGVPLNKWITTQRPQISTLSWNWPITSSTTSKPTKTKTTTTTRQPWQWQTTKKAATLSYNWQNNKYINNTTDRTMSNQNKNFNYLSSTPKVATKPTTTKTTTKQPWHSHTTKKATTLVDIKPTRKDTSPPTIKRITTSTTPASTKTSKSPMISRTTTTLRTTLRTTPTTRTTKPSRTTPITKSTPIRRTTSTSRITPTTRTPARTTLTSTSRTIQTPTTRRTTTKIPNSIQTNLYKKFQNATNNGTKTVYAYGFGQNRPFVNKHEGAHDFDMDRTPAVQAAASTAISNINQNLKKTNALQSKNVQVNMVNPIPVLWNNQANVKKNETNIFDLYLNWNKKKN